jgi:hypothetical protein
VRRHDDERHCDGDIRAGRGEICARLTIEHEEQRKRHGQHDDEIFRPQRKPDRQAKQHPMQHAAAAQRRMKREAGKRPERQLDHVVIEFCGSEMQVMLTVDNEQRHERAHRPDHRARHRPYCGKGRDDRDLRERVEEHVAPEHSKGRFHQPPRQRRQLVIAELPFPAIGQRLDQVERQIGIEQRRQRSPHQEMQQREGCKCGAGMLLDRSGEIGGTRHCGIGCRSPLRGQCVCCRVRCDPDLRTTRSSGTLDAKANHRRVCSWHVRLPFSLPSAWRSSRARPGLWRISPLDGTAPNRRSWHLVH